MNQLGNVGKLRNLVKGQFVCTEGELGNSLFILLKGTAEVVLDSYADKIKKIEKIEEGSFFGEMSLLENKPRTATIVIASPSAIVVEINQNDFAKLIENEPNFGYRILRTLNGRINQMIHTIGLYDKKIVAVYEGQEMYQTIQKMNEEEFTLICKKNKEYVWRLLKFLSSSLTKLNQIYIQYENMK